MKKVHQGDLIKYNKKLGDVGRLNTIEYNHLDF